MKKYNRTLLAIAVVFLSYTLILIGYIYFSFSKYAFDDFYKRLEVRVSTIATINLGTPSEAASVEKTFTKFLEELPNQQYAILKFNNKSVSGDIPNNLPRNFIDKLIVNKKYSVNKDELFFSGIVYTDKNNQQYLVITSAENYFYSHHI